MKIVLVEHMDEVLKEAIVSDGPILQQDILVPPTSLPINEVVGTNVNLS
jgi:hypothetical protein